MTVGINEHVGDVKLTITTDTGRRVHDVNLSLEPAVAY